MHRSDLCSLLIKKMTEKNKVMVLRGGQFLY